MATMSCESKCLTMTNVNLFVRLLWLLTLSYGLCSSEAWTSENNLEVLEDDFPRLPYVREIKTTHRMTLYSGNDDRKTSNVDDIVAGIIKKAELSNPVVLRSWRVNPPPTDHKTVSVDSTVVNLLVEVHSKGVSPRFQVYDPTGEVVSPTDDRNITMEVNSNRLKIMKIKNPITGDWLVTFPSKRHEYNVTIRGSSMIQFRCRFINGWGIPLSGRPIVGSNVTLRLELFGGEDVKMLTEVTLMTLAGTTILTRPLGKAMGRRHRAYAAHIRIPGEDFRVGIRGLDMRSNVIERTLMNPIVPDGIKLSLKALTPGTVQTGGSYVLQYRIVNDGTGTGNFTVTALSDTPYLTFTVTPDCAHITAGDHAQGNVTVHVSEYAVPGSKSDVIVRATNTSGNFQFSSREVSIVSPPNDEDTHAPAFSTTNIIDNCDSAQSSTWEVVFQVQDDESGIHKVDVDDHTVSTITMETFDDGQANMPVKGHLSIQCSRKEVTVIVDDVEGNEGRFLVTHGRHQGTTSSYVSVKGEKSSEAHITAIFTGFLAGCLFLTILVTVTIQFKMRLTHRRNVVYAKTEKKVPCTSRRMDMQVF